MSTTTLTEKQLFVQGSLTTDIAEMIELLAVNVPGVKSCNVNASLITWNKIRNYCLN